MTADVLIVDDSEFQRTIIRDALSGPCEVAAEAADGAAAVSAFHDVDPDLVTMDIMMPEKDGIAATRDIKSVDPETAVVMCTSVEQREKMREAVKAGADDYVTKPLDPDALRETVRTHL